MESVFESKALCGSAELSSKLYAFWQDGRGSLLKHNVRMSLERGTNGIFPFSTGDGSTQGQTTYRHVLHSSVALNKLLSSPHINEEGALLLDS